MNTENSTVPITGANRGIGRALIDEALSRAPIGCMQLPANRSPTRTRVSRISPSLLRDAVSIQAVRAELMEMVRKEFLLNVADNLEEVESRLKEWITQTQTPSGTLYKVGINRDRLWLTLLHAGYSLEQQRDGDRGEKWPL